MPSIKRPTQRPMPESFWREFADAYHEASALTPHPNRLIAEESGIPTKTVQRWAYQARKLGYLPTAVRGRAGGPDDGLRTCRTCHGRGKVWAGGSD